MRTDLIVLAERLVLLAGFIAIVIAASGLDWRLGLFVAGVLLVISTSPWKDLR
jgi:hypothetical protein